MSVAMCWLPVLFITPYINNVLVHAVKKTHPNTPFTLALERVVIKACKEWEHTHPFDSSSWPVHVQCNIFLYSQNHTPRCSYKLEFRSSLRVHVTSLAVSYY